MSAVNTSAYYLYCLANADQIKTVNCLGIDTNKQVQHKCVGTVAAVYGEVHTGLFVGPEAEAKLSDINEIGPLVLCHEKVVEEVATFSPVLPCRFATLFTSLEQLESFLHTEQERIATTLQNVSDKEEWSIKGYVDKKKWIRDHVASLLAERAEELDKLTPGARYLQEKKLSTAAKTDFRKWLQQQLKIVADMLEPCIVELTQRKTLSRQASGKEEDMVFNWAVLLTRTHLSELMTQTDMINLKYRGQGLVLIPSGPWPPYSFCPKFSLHQEE